MVADTVLVAVIGILVLLGYVVYRVHPKRFKLTIEGGWKQIKLNVEADSGPGADAQKPADGRHPPLPDEEQKACRRSAAID